MSAKRILPLILLCCLLSIPASTFACKCGTTSLPLSVQVKDFLANHPFQTGTVFLGKVIAIPTFGGQSTFTFAVERWWHTPVNSEVQVETNSSQAACGYPFVNGQKYLVFATKDRSNVWYTSICHSTTNKPAPFMSILGEGQKPIPLPKTLDPVVLNLVGFVILIGAMFVSYLISRRNKRHKPYSI